MTASTSDPAKPAKPVKPQVGNKNMVQNIFFGGTAGVIGQSCVFPMYTVKTRLHLFPGRYNSVFHCVRKVIQHDGLRGLYRGLPPALTGVFPEKAIKLSMNDYLTATFSRPDGTISIPMAMLAGGGAGLSQVVATNPMEMLMINMQSSAASGRKPKSMFHLARDLGLSGLYKGTSATLFRDIPFSMVFFSMNTSLRVALTDDKGNLPIGNVFLAGILSGSTAAAMSTPMDVIKTRLQASAGEKKQAEKPSLSNAIPKTAAVSSTTPPSRSMSTASAASIRYQGIADCARHIYSTEGARGFFAGVGPRILIISPLFGITLFFYDIQRRLQQMGKL